MSITIGIPKEIKEKEKRIAMVPVLLDKLIKSGATINIEKDVGSFIYVDDISYKGAKVLEDAKRLYASSDVILKVQPPTEEEVHLMKDQTILISFLYPHNNLKLIKILLQKNISSFAMELIPRISRAQDMDALSSQATVAGYKAVLIAADNSRFFFPMLTTAAGSIRPAKVLVIGSGVAGLQAMATAKRLGAIVFGYDVRTETKEQVESLGAKFIDVKIKANGKGGYARELTKEEKEEQTVILAKHMAECDVVITTAGIPGKAAPKIITISNLEKMRSGSIIVDLMAESGGNCEMTSAGEVVKYKQVTIIGPLNICSSLPIPSSEMYAKNITNFLLLLLQNEKINFDFNDEILASSVVTHQGKIINSTINAQINAQIKEQFNIITS
ncbi:MAG: Re/Si-specific NAD(P)(+) transhydrogenase subunit alpha [Oligoflexia bacterium]|nr:Re/Si-specific NAD(P)(+) transhydrogenase subunit alpha [Oligoflexia bacterium]